MAYDYSRLRGRIVERCGTQKSFAEQIGLSERSVSMKLNNILEWNQNEIKKTIEVLGIQAEEIAVFFFADQVQS